VGFGKSAFLGDVRSNSAGIPLFTIGILSGLINSEVRLYCLYTIIC
jgi:hypothetical protein